MGSGTMTPTITNLGVYGETYNDGPCVSFDDSLDRLFLGDKCGPYGLQGSNCDALWAAWQRESWILSLIDAQQEIESDIGTPICPREICNETHILRSEVHLRQSPIAYLGQRVWGEWTELELQEGDDDTWFVDICQSELGEDVTPEFLQFSYPDSVLLCYSGNQLLQSPCVATLTGSCGEGMEDGYRFSWPICQLVLPDVDKTSASETDNFLKSVKWRSYTIPPNTGWEIVGECGCSSCQSGNYSVSILDAVEGIVCVEGVCSGNSTQRIRFNYATSADCYGPSSYLLGAVVLLALVNTGKTAAKPCGCDNRNVDHLLSIDPSSSTEFARRLRYGPTVAGMRVMQRVDKYMNRKNFNSTVLSGGFLSSMKPRSVVR